MQVLGLDIGGANLKAAHSIGVACSRPFALWKQPDRLAEKLREMQAALPPASLVAVTMTAELCDCFATRAEGVQAILTSAEDAAAGTPLRIWTTHGTLLKPAQVRADPQCAASANWLALAHLAARSTEDEPGLLIDAGSTTTDIVYFADGRPQPHGYTDRERLVTGELVYTGLRRTPICAVLGLGVAAELFATMLDAYVVLGLVPGNSRDSDTADGRPATRAAARTRLARMRCADGDSFSPAEAEELAKQAIDAQIAHLHKAVDQVLRGRNRPKRIVLSGSGEAIGRLVVAAHPKLVGSCVVSLADRLGAALSEAACAYAVALLATRRPRR
jgi:probable H4MPT-linked C1 transfer pathway protein